MVALPYLSIVIPLFNERERLPKNLESIINYFSVLNSNFEIILVNDGSKDGTENLVNTLQKTYPFIRSFHLKHNFGKGAAIKKGMIKSKGQIILVTDCDLSTPINEFATLNKYISNYDIIIGSRRLKIKKLGNMPPTYRTFLGDIYYELLRLILLPSIKDTNCGFKIFKRKTIDKVFSKQRINRWGYDAEVLYIAQKNGFKIKEVPVKWSHKDGSKVKVFNAAVKTLLELFQIKLNSWRGLYN